MQSPYATRTRYTGHPPRTYATPHLEDILLGALEVLEAPLIHCTVHSSRYQLGVIRQPGHARYLAIMAPAQQCSIIRTCAGVDTDSPTDRPCYLASMAPAQQCSIIRACAGVDTDSLTDRPRYLTIMVPAQQRSIIRTCAGVETDSLTDRPLFYTLLIWPPAQQESFTSIRHGLGIDSLTDKLEQIPEFTDM